jgi:hypothetical protein
MDTDTTYVWVRIVAVVGALLSLVVSFVFCGGLATDAEVIRSVETAGYSKVVILNRNRLVSWKCSRGDASEFTVEAENSQGKRVELILCVGTYPKGNTLRVK